MGEKRGWEYDSCEEVKVEKCWVVQPEERWREKRKSCLCAVQTTMMGGMMWEIKQTRCRAVRVALPSLTDAPTSYNRKDRREGEQGRWWREKHVKIHGGTVGWERERRLVTKGSGAQILPPLYKTTLHRSPWRNMLDSVNDLSYFPHTRIFSHILY